MEFNVWDIAGKQQAAEEIAKRVERMQQDYKEIIIIAAELDVRISLSLQKPEDLRLGHNANHLAEIHWNPSSQYC